MAFLKDIIIENGGTPIDFEFVSRSPEYKKKKKDGSFMDVYDYVFKTRADGNQTTEMIFKKTHEFSLCKAVPGQLCRASVSADGKWVNWEVLPMGPESANIPSVGNTRQVAGERAVTQSNVAALAHDWKLGLAGIVQAMLIQGKSQIEITGQANNPEFTALGWARWIRKTAEELAQPKEDADFPYMQ